MACLAEEWQRRGPLLAKRASQDEGEVGSLVELEMARLASVAQVGEQTTQKRRATLALAWVEALLGEGLTRCFRALGGL